MKKPKNGASDPQMPDEYDFSGGIRGKYADAYARSNNLVFLAPDVAKVFPDSDSVNTALRALIRIARDAAGEGVRRDE